MLVQKEFDDSFNLSKVRLEQIRWGLTVLQKHKVKNNSTFKSKTHIQHVDLITLLIPFICLLFVTMTICMVNIFKTSFLPSIRPGPDSAEPMHGFNPNIKITEPSSSVAPWEDSTARDVNHTQLMYLSPQQM